MGGGFLYEVIKDNFGEEWKDDSNSNCLVYEGGYCKGERQVKGISHDFDGEWINNQVITEDEKNDLIVPTSIEEFLIDSLE